MLLLVLDKNEQRAGRDELVASVASSEESGEVDAFWALVALVEHILPAHYFDGTLSGLYADLRLFGQLLQVLSPPSISFLVPPLRIPLIYPRKHSDPTLYLYVVQMRATLCAFGLLREIAVPVGEQLAARQHAQRVLVRALVGSVSLRVQLVSHPVCRRVPAPCVPPHLGLSTLRGQQGIVRTCDSYVFLIWLQRGCMQLLVIPLHSQVVLPFLAVHIFYLKTQRM